MASDANYVALSQVNAPTLVITGAQDVITPPANSTRIARAIRGSRLQFIAGAGHSFLFQKPTVVATRILAFLR